MKIKELELASELKKRNWIRNWNEKNGIEPRSGLYIIVSTGM